MVPAYDCASGGENLTVTLRLRPAAISCGKFGESIVKAEVSEITLLTTSIAFPEFDMVSSQSAYSPIRTPPKSCCCSDITMLGSDTPSGCPNGFSYAPISGTESDGAGRGFPSMSVVGIPSVIVPAPMHGLEADKRQWSLVVSTKIGSAFMLPSSQLNVPLSLITISACPP